MRKAGRTRLQQVLVFLTGLLIVKVTAEVVLGYRNYFPANFNSDFLRGRAVYFFGSYQWAFYTHIVAGPISLIAGMLLISERFRQRLPNWHRALGRVQVATVLMLVAPSGLWMAWYSPAGTVAAIGFAVLACLTALCAGLGWKAAVQRRFTDHRRWMWRCYLLLCSAVVLRLLGGLATVLGVHEGWFDAGASWACWILPLAVFEVGVLFKHRNSRVSVHPRNRLARNTSRG